MHFVRVPIPAPSSTCSGRKQVDYHVPYSTTTLNASTRKQQEWGAQHEGHNPYETTQQVGAGEGPRAGGGAGLRVRQLGQRLGPAAWGCLGGRGTSKRGRREGGGQHVGATWGQGPTAGRLNCRAEAGCFKRERRQDKEHSSYAATQQCEFSGGGDAQM